ncbi:MAG: helix-turn-helix domain-containing protein [Proteobacteria bacterium]|nr:helix-turn-helix domain-containing protein [Pseudomonadota bacterium]
MTPLDSGSESDVYRSPSWDDDAPPISLADAATLSEGLRAAREASGRSLDDLADATRVRKQYLIALEEGAWDRLPSRPFSTGYVRAYARALGLDEETAADRFKTEAPDHATQLRAPVGSELDDVKPRHTPWIVGAVVLISAVVLWNVARHAMTGQKSHTGDLAAASSHEKWSLGWPGLGSGGDGNVIRISAPQAAPKDQTVPAPYITPGLEAELSQGQPVVAAAGPAVPVGAAFNPKGAIYGAGPTESVVLVQALKPVGVVLRGSDGTVYFAKQLAAGESYRVPNGGGQVLDVSDPTSLSLYMNGEYRGPLAAAVTSTQQMFSQAQGLAAAAQRQQAAQAPSQATPAPDAGGDTPG